MTNDPNLPAVSTLQSAWEAIRLMDDLDRNYILDRILATKRDCMSEEEWGRFMRYVERWKAARKIQGDSTRGEDNV